MKKVLVVDDDPGIRDLLAEELRYRGYSPIVAGNGSEALDCLGMMTPDAIVLDLMMPVMDGWTFVQHYRDQAGRGTAPIIAISADGDLPPRYKALGVTVFLRKPFDLNELANCIGQLTSVSGGEHGASVPTTIT
jgi:two-component system chemotaxis response regulator CheY